MRIFAVKHKLIETYFDDLVSSEFESVTEKKTVVPIHLFCQFWSGDMFGVI